MSKETKAANATSKKTVEFTHPEVYNVMAHCACGNKFQTTSTRKELEVTICSNCHPFFTGAQKFVDTAGRIQKFEQKYNKKKK